MFTLCAYAHIYALRLCLSCLQTIKPQNGFYNVKICSHIIANCVVWSLYIVNQ